MSRVTITHGPISSLSMMSDFWLPALCLFFSLFSFPQCEEHAFLYWDFCLAGALRMAEEKENDGPLVFHLPKSSRLNEVQLSLFTQSFFHVSSTTPLPHFCRSFLMISGGNPLEKQHVYPCLWHSSSSRQVSNISWTLPKPHPYPAHFPAHFPAHLSLPRWAGTHLAECPAWSPTRCLCPPWPWWAEVCHPRLS